MRDNVLNSVKGMVLILVMVLSSCASHKNSSDVLKQQNIVASGTVVANVGDKEMSAPAKLTVNRGQMVRLQVMMPFLGSEMVRIEFLPENVVVLDRMHKQYISENYATISRLAKRDLSFASVQSTVLEYLAMQSELKMDIPMGNKAKPLSLGYSFSDIKATTDQEQPTEVSGKFKKISLGEIGNLLKVE